MRWIMPDPKAPHQPANPCTHLRAEGEFNEERNFYITPRLVDALIDECPDLELRAMIALSRYASFRGPSEFEPLLWHDVDFDRGMVTITSTKTKRYRNGARRSAPLNGEALKRIEELWEAADEGVTRVFPRLGNSDSSRLNQRLNTLCRRLGVPLWDKPFTNMRASCETDWQEAGHQALTTATWMGHSVAVALQHYNRVAKDRVVDLPPGNPKRSEATRNTKTEAEPEAPGCTRHVPGSTEIGQ